MWRNVSPARLWTKPTNRRARAWHMLLSTGESPSSTIITSRASPKSTKPANTTLRTFIRPHDRPLPPQHPSPHPITLSPVRAPPPHPTHTPHVWGPHLFALINNRDSGPPTPCPPVVLFLRASFSPSHRLIRPTTPCRRPRASGPRPRRRTKRRSSQTRPPTPPTLCRRPPPLPTRAQAARQARAPARRGRDEVFPQHPVQRCPRLEQQLHCLQQFEKAVRTPLIQALAGAQRLGELRGSVVH